MTSRVLPEGMVIQPQRLEKACIMSFRDPEDSHGQTESRDPLIIYKVLDHRYLLHLTGGQTLGRERAIDPHHLPLHVPSHIIGVPHPGDGVDIRPQFFGDLAGKNVKLIPFGNGKE
jgi:hypothetical protein